MLLEYIWEKEPFDNGEHDKELDSDDKPELFAKFHIFETFDVKGDDL
jgi:hypothetical protein